MEYPKNLDPRATPAYRGAWSTPKMCQYSGCYHAKFGDFWLNGIIIITDGGSDVRFHADVGVYEHTRVLNSGGGLDKGRAYTDCCSWNLVLSLTRRTP